MTITHLKVSAVRNLVDVDLNPSSGLNLFYGENGSGKTSLLEAISLLAHGRSFRTVNYRQLVTHGMPQLAVFAEVSQCIPSPFAPSSAVSINAVSSSNTLKPNPSTDSNPNLNPLDDDLLEDKPYTVKSRVGVLRPLRGASAFKIDGSAVYSSASLASLLPLQVMNAKSYDLLEGPSKVRRKMFDWLVFHVKHEFSLLWRNYTKAVKQRNTLLRRDKIPRSELAPWDLELNRLAISIDALRKECMAPFIERVNCLIPKIGLPENYTISIKYQRGWPDDAATLQEALAATFERDKAYGYTTCGAHKSELKVLVNNIPAADILSRGQQKSLVAAFLIAELQLFEEFTQRQSVLLIDDLPAELDQEHIRMLAQWLNELDTQIFVTGIYSADMEILQQTLNKKPCKVFHVKQGKIEQSSPS